MGQLVLYIVDANQLVLCVLLLCLFGYLLALSSRRRRVALLVLLNLAILETMLQITNGFYPLFRPTNLVDTQEHLWLDGHDWDNGLTRLYIYQSKSGAMTYGHPFHVNHYGFRGKEFLDRKSEGDDTFRIMVIGDSFTAGIGVAEEDRYPEVLGRQLSQKYPDVKIEVVNLGVQGHETIQEYKILQRMWPVVQPDLTVVGFVFNDPNIQYNHHGVHRLPIEGKARAFVEKSITFRILDELLYDWIKRKITQEPSQSEEALAAYEPGSPDWTIFERSVKGMGEFVLSETGKPPMAIYLMDASGLLGALTQDEWKKKPYYWSVKKTFDKSGFAWVDLPSGFSYQPVSRFEGHPNEITHVRYADALFKKIVELGIVPSWQKSSHRLTKTL